MNIINYLMSFLLDTTRTRCSYHQSSAMKTLSAYHWETRFWLMENLLSQAHPTSFANTITLRTSRSATHYGETRIFPIENLRISLAHSTSCANTINEQHWNQSTYQWETRFFPIISPQHIQSQALTPSRSEHQDPSFTAERLDSSQPKIRISPQHMQPHALIPSHTEA